MGFLRDWIQHGWDYAYRRGAERSVREMEDKTGTDLQSDTAFGGGTATTAPEPPPPRDYSALTGAQMASLGYGNDWYSQYQDVFNPQGSLPIDPATGQVDWNKIYGAAPIAQGYQDENGNWVVTGPQMGAYQAYMLRSQDPYAWMQGQGMQPISQTWGAVNTGLQALIDQILGRQPGSEAENAYTAERMGYGSWDEYTADLQRRRAQEQLGEAGQEGLTNEQESKLQRARGLTVQDMQKQAREMMGALAGSGRSIAAFQQMDAAIGQIANYDAQQQAYVMQLDINEKRLQYEAVRAQLEGLTGEQAELADQFNTELNAIQAGALGAYAQRITALAGEYDDYSQQWNDHAEAYYRSMMADLGLSEAAMDTAYQNYSQYMLPYLDQMQIWNTEQIQDLIDELMNS